MSEKLLNPEVWMHKKTGQLYEHFQSVLGPALVKIDLEAKEVPFTNWNDWIDRGLFAFSDDKLYDKSKFENLGEL